MFIQEALLKANVKDLYKSNTKKYTNLYNSIPIKNFTKEIKRV